MVVGIRRPLRGRLNPHPERSVHGQGRYGNDTLVSEVTEYGQYVHGGDEAEWRLVDRVD